MALKDNVSELNKLMKKFEAEKKNVATSRDKLREILEEIEVVFFSADDSIEEFDDALNLMRKGIDTLSQYV